MNTDVSVLEAEAVLRITSAQQIASIAGDLALAIGTLPPETAQKLYPVFLLLAECQADLLRTDSTLPQQVEAEETPLSVREANAERVAYHLSRLQQHEPGERAHIVRQRTGWSKSAYYRARADAMRFGLL
jgi:hypothetical protein